MEPYGIIIRIIHVVLKCPLCKKILMLSSETHPDNKVHGINMGPIWGQQDPVGHHVGPMNFAVCAYLNSPL